MGETDIAAVAPVSHAIFRVARLHKSIAGRLLREVGLHPGQELVLLMLWAQGPLRIVDLVDAVESDAPSMTRSVARLEKVGLVRRTPSPTDRRAVLVEATEASLALRARVEEAWGELERLTVQALSERHQAQALRSLALLEESLAGSG